MHRLVPGALDLCAILLLLARTYNAAVIGPRHLSLIIFLVKPVILTALHEYLENTDMKV